MEALLVAFGILKGEIEIKCFDPVYLCFSRRLSIYEHEYIPESSSMIKAKFVFNGNYTTEGNLPIFELVEIA